MFRKFFQRNQRKEFAYSPEEVLAKLKVLENAISDVGYWSWWTSEFPKHIMLEFGGTQIWSEPKDSNSPPSGKIGVTFLQPYSVSFITREWNEKAIPADWIDLLHNDKLELPEIENGNFTFTDIELINQIYKEAKSVETVYGYKPTDPQFKDAEFKFGFWAFNFGCIISCRSLNLVNNDGELSLDDIEKRNEKWWDYWKEYWKKRDSSDPMPKDYACEVTIPVKKWRYKKTE